MRTFLSPTSFGRGFMQIVDYSERYAPVLASTFAITNPTHEDAEFRGGLTAYLSPGGLETTAEFDLGGRRTWEPKHASADAWTERGPVIIHRAGRAPFVALVAGGGEPLGVWDLGASGRHASIDRKVSLDTGAARRFLFFTLVSASLADAREAGSLQKASADDFAPHPTD